MCNRPTTLGALKDEVIKSPAWGGGASTLKRVDDWADTIAELTLDPPPTAAAVKQLVLAGVAGARGVCVV